MWCAVIVKIIVKERFSAVRHIWYFYCYCFVSKNISFYGSIRRGIWKSSGKRKCCKYVRLFLQIFGIFLCAHLIKIDIPLKILQKCWKILNWKLILGLSRTGILRKLMWHKDSLIFYFTHYHFVQSYKHKPTHVFFSLKFKSNCT